MALPWFKLYAAVWRADTENLGAASRGAHVDLTCARWLGRDLVDDDVQLARAARMTVDEWAQAKTELLRDVWRIEGGRWRWDWLEEQLETARSYSDEQRERSQRAVEARRLRRDQAGNRADDRPDHQANSPSVNRADNPSRSESEEKRPEESRSTSESDATDADADAEPREVIRRFESWFGEQHHKIGGAPWIPHTRDRETIRGFLAEGHDISADDFRRRVEIILMKRKRAQGTLPASLEYVATALSNGAAQ